MTDIVAKLRSFDSDYDMHYLDDAAGEIERLRKELADLEEATTPWRELQDMKKRIDELEPVVFAYFKDGELDFIDAFGDECEPYTVAPLYDLRGIKE